MNKISTLKDLFNKWLKLNNSKFNFKPLKVSENRYKFEGIIENIYLVLDEDELSSYMAFDDFKGNNYGQTYLDGIMELCEDKKGFYDNYDETRVYFNSYEQMVYERVFSHILNYCDTYFNSGSELYLADNVCYISHLICPGEEDQSGCKKLQTLITNGVYLGSERPKEDIGVVKITKYDLFDSTKECETSYIRDERSTELLFEKWLEENRNRFAYKPKRTKDGNYFFDGIIKNIYLRIACEECSIGFDDNAGENYDHLDIEYIEELDYKEGKGYYDVGTTEYYIERNLPIPYYKTYEGIIQETLFETLINFCEKHFVKENSLYLMDSSGWSSASIKVSTWDKENIDNDDGWEVVKLGLFDEIIKYI